MVEGSERTVHAIVHIAFLAPQLKNRLWPWSYRGRRASALRCLAQSDLGTFYWMENGNEEVVAGHRWLGIAGNSG